MCVVEYFQARLEAGIGTHPLAALPRQKGEQEAGQSHPIDPVFLAMALFA